MDTQMLIGSRFEAGTETEEPSSIPKTGETILKLPEASLGPDRCGRRCRREGLQDLVADDARRSAPAIC